MFASLLRLGKVANKVQIVQPMLKQVTMVRTSVPTMLESVRTMAHNTEAMRKQEKIDNDYRALYSKVMNAELPLTKLPKGERRRRASKYYKSFVPGNVIRTARLLPVKPTFNMNLNKLDGTSIGSVQLKNSVFAQPIRSDIIKRVVVWQLAKRRQGTHKSLSRSEVTGTTRKPHPQKGTGRARASCLRSPLHYKGGRAFPRRVRDYSFALPRKVRNQALRIVLSAKRKEKRLTLIDSLADCEGKTKTLNTQLKAFSSESTLLIIGQNEANCKDYVKFYRAIRNLSRVDVLPAEGANVYDILKHKHLILTSQGLNDVYARLERNKREIKYPGKEIKLIPLAQYKESLAKKEQSTV